MYISHIFCLLQRFDGDGKGKPTPFTWPFAILGLIPKKNLTILRRLMISSYSAMIRTKETIM
ncbi:hypothetical protein ACFLYI_03055, partial [Chloroflexota bacterium]